MDVGRHPNIELYAYSEVQEIRGSAGNFQIRLSKKARYVKEKECTACGLCVEKCPSKVPDQFNLGLSQRKAIYQYFPQGIPPVMTIDRDHCLYFQKDICRTCEKVCERKAIDFTQQDQEIGLEAGAIIIATGFDPSDPSSLPQYGYRRYPDVITALEFERLSSASGPTGGRILRPSNQEEVRRVGFIQCVGSRDQRSCQYCSAVCCMFATKEAILANEHDERVESFIFYTDLRGSGKGFQEYINRGSEEYKIRYVRSRVAQVTPGPEGRLTIWYEDLAQRTQASLEVDLVVLVNGLLPSRGLERLARIAGIELDRYGFIKTDPYSPTMTTVPGILACGYCEGPKDIPESVAQASCAAAKAMEFLNRR